MNKNMKDTNTLLASLVEKMEKARILRPEGKHGNYKLRRIGIHNAAINQCITIIKEAMK